MIVDRFGRVVGSLILVSLITQMASATSITISEPAAGDIWERGTTHFIRWSPPAGVANVTISLYKDTTVPSAKIVNSTPNDGEYEWTIPATAIAGTDRRIRVASTSDPVGVFGFSERFTIPESPTRIIRLDPSNLAFGDVPVGTLRQRDWRIWNDGNSDLTVTSISYPPPFDGYHVGSIPITIRPNEYFQVNVNFRPTVAESYSGDITVYSNKTSGTNTLRCSGTGIVVYTLAVNSSGASSVNIGSSTEQGGTTNYTKSLTSGTSVSLTAPATASGKGFTGWMGSVTSSNQTINFSMDGDKTVTANYDIPPRYTLTVNSSPVSGVSISSTSAHGGTTSYTWSVTRGSLVNLTAPSTAGGNPFTGWTGSVASISRTIDFAMDSEKTVTANFTTLRTLTVSASPGGLVTTPGEGSFQYVSGASVPIVAAPGSGYTFVNWTGTAVNAGRVANPNAASTSVTVDADYTLVANFASEPPLSHKLDISSGTGGRVTSPGEGTFVYTAGERATVVASANSGYHFVNWTGTAATAGQVANRVGASTTVTVSADYTLIANFAADQGTLVFSAGEGGQVIQPLVPKGSEYGFTYDGGTAVSIKAKPDEGYRFVNWTGMAVDAGMVADRDAASTIVTVTGNASIKANFEKDTGSIHIAVTDHTAGEIVHYRFDTTGEERDQATLLVPVQSNVLDFSLAQYDTTDCREYYGGFLGTMKRVTTPQSSFIDIAITNDAGYSNGICLLSGKEERFDGIEPGTYSVGCSLTVQVLRKEETAPVLIPPGQTTSLPPALFIDGTDQYGRYFVYRIKGIRSGDFFHYEVCKMYTYTLVFSTAVEVCPGKSQFVYFPVCMDPHVWLEVNSQIAYERKVGEEFLLIAGQSGQAAAKAALDKAATELLDGAIKKLCTDASSVGLEISLLSDVIIMARDPDSGFTEENVTKVFGGTVACHVVGLALSPVGAVAGGPAGSFFVAVGVSTACSMAWNAVWAHLSEEKVKDLLLQSYMDDISLMYEDAGDGKMNLHIHNRGAPIGTVLLYKQDAGSERMLIAGELHVPTNSCVVLRDIDEKYLVPEPTDDTYTTLSFVPMLDDLALEEEVRLTEWIHSFDVDATCEFDQRTFDARVN